ncbi:MAG: hypothetical protein FJY67_08535 [Calditrichaeota bacterium]|nr:hypothetical protein [Calditrichota bacterium]
MNQPNVERVTVPEPGGGSAPAKKKSPVGLIVIIVAVLGGGFAAWKFLPIFHKPHLSAEADTMQTTGQPPPFGEVVILEDLIINPVGSRRVFMCSVGIEVKDVEKAKEVRKRESLLRDNLLTLFSSQPMEVLIDIKYRQAFRARVKKIMDYQLGAGVVNRVFFEKWVFQ